MQSPGSGALLRCSSGTATHATTRLHTILPVDTPFRLVASRLVVKWGAMVMITVLILIMQACGGGDELPTVDCTDPPSFAEVSAFSACTICHASTLQGTNRAGAPSGVDYDTYESAVSGADRAVVRVYAGTMPPVGSLAEKDKGDLYVWALCGTPP